MTLVELLAAISLLAIVILLAGSIHMFGQRQFKSQADSASQANDFSYALTVMSTDLRRKIPTVIEENESYTKLKLQDGTTYTFRENLIEINDNALITGLSKNALTTLDNEKIVLNLELNNSSPGIQNKKYTTTIYFRDTSGGPSDD